VWRIGLRAAPTNRVLVREPGQFPLRVVASAQRRSSFRYRIPMIHVPAPSFGTF
jgi:hypothetical protein